MMSKKVQKSGLNRRAFLRNAGLTAAASAISGGTASFASESLSFGETAPDSMFDFDAPYDRSGTHCIKWDRQYEKYGKENVQAGMGIADMDFRAAPCIGEAIAERSKHENWGYMSMPKSYIESIVDWNRDRHGIEVDPDSVVISAGVHPGLIAALRAFSPPGSKVLLTTPTYNGFYGDLRWSDTVKADSPMKKVNGRYEIDFDDFEARIDPDTHAFILCNPQNPTGNCWSEEDLMRLGEICLKRRIIVLADEIHCDFIMKGQKYTPFASLPDKDIVNNSLTFKAISKTFSLAAMKNAYFFSTNPAHLERVKAKHRPDINTLGVVANEAAYRKGAAWVDQLLPYIDGNHDYVESYMKEKMPLVSYTKAQGTYLAWLDVSKLIDRIDAKAKAEAETKKLDEGEPKVTPELVVEKWFVDHAKVQLNAGHTYGTGGEGHMRMNLGTSRKTIAMALDNMAAAMDKL